MTEERSDIPLPFTEDEKALALRLAAESMSGAQKRWAERVKTGLTDEQLAAALKYEFGAFGGSARDTVGVTYQGDGLKLWADHCVGSRQNKPLLEGRSMIAFARRVYGIPDPNDKQMALFS